MSIDVNNCNDDHCEFRRGESTALTLTFRTTNEAIKLESTLKAKVAFVFVSVPNGKIDVCEHMLNQKCPVPANTEVIYKVEFVMPSLAPAGTRTTLQLQIADQNKNVVSCVQVPALVA